MARSAGRVKGNEVAERSEGTLYAAEHRAPLLRAMVGRAQRRSGRLLALGVGQGWPAPKAARDYSIKPNLLAPSDRRADGPAPVNRVSPTPVAKKTPRIHPLETLKTHHMFLPTMLPVPNHLAKGIARRLVRERAFGADLLEVGYQFRGRPIRDHLALWDHLAGVDAFLTGVGVTDLHNSTPWLGVKNRFATWVEADTLSQADLLRGLNLGRACFGDPFLVGSDAYVDLHHSDGDFVMGDVVVSSLSQAPLRLEGRISAAAMNASVVTVHPAGTDTTRLELLGPAFAESVMVDIYDRCHVRVELADPVAESILLASNPIYFRRTPPSPLSPGMRMRRVVDLN